MIELKNLCKNFGLTKALIDVSISVKKGEIIGFVGPNGAGKSTAMRIITTYTAPSSGTVKVGGYDVIENPLEIRNMIGYLPERVPLYSDMLVHEYLAFIGSARHLNGSFKKRLDWVIQACGLESVMNRKIEVLSKGYKQRTCLAQALIHDPDILILDEPTSGLDPLQIIGIRNLIKELAHEKTIILSTHILPEVATVADRILMINEGRIVADGSFDQLVQQVSDRGSLYVGIKGSKKEFQSGIQSLKGIEDISYDETAPRGVTAAHLYYGVKTDMIVPLNELIRSKKWSLVELKQEQISLEETFIRLTKPDSSKVDKQESKSDGEGGIA